MRNIGKVFEDSLKHSVPSYALLYRLPDSAQAFDKNSGLRFSKKNPFDFLLWDSKRHILYALEAKTVSGKSISFERAKSDYGGIHLHQIKGLSEWSKYDGIIAGFIIEFRGLNKTVFIDIDSFKKLTDIVTKKSINYDDIISNDISYQVISQQKKRTRYTYNLGNFLSAQGNKRKIKNKNTITATEVKK